MKKTKPSSRAKSPGMNPSKPVKVAKIKVTGGKKGPMPKKGN